MSRKSMNESWRDAIEKDNKETQIKRLKEALYLEQNEVKALNEAIKQQQEKITSLELTIVELVQQKIELTEKFLNHIQERQRDDKEWIESLRKRY